MKGFSGYTFIRHVKGQICEDYSNLINHNLLNQQRILQLQNWKDLTVSFQHTFQYPKNVCLIAVLRGIQQYFSYNTAVSIVGEAGELGWKHLPLEAN